MNKAFSNVLVATGIIGASQLEKSVQAAPTFPFNGLTRYYNFNEGGGNLAADATGGHNIIVSNSWAQQGKLGAAYNPNGNPYQTGFVPQTGVSVNFWIKKTVGDWGFYNDIIGTGAGSGNFYIDTWGSPQGILTYLAPGVAPTTGLYESPSYHMFTLTIKNGEQKTYLDEVLQFSSSLNYPFSSNSIKLFGNLGGGAPNGIMNIDELGIWNRALGQSEVSALYNGGLGLGYNVPEAPTLGLIGLSGLAAARRKRAP